MSKHLPEDAFSAVRCNSCGHIDGFHRMGCTSCVSTDVVHGYFMPPDGQFVSNDDLRAQGYVGDDEPTNESEGKQS